MTVYRARVGVIMPLGHQQGGAENLLLHWLRQGSQRFELICAFLQDGPLVEVIRAMGLSVTVFPTTHLTDSINYLRTARGLRRWVRREGLTAVLSWMPKAHLYAAPAAWGTGVRLLWYQHGVPSPSRLNRLNSWLPADRVLCCSETSQAGQRTLSRIDRTVVCYPGVRFPVDALSREQARTQLRLPATASVVGMVARWERWKGVHIFLEAIKSGAAELPNTIFFVAGGEHPRDPDYAAQIRRQVAEANLGGRLRLLGQIPPDEVSIWLAAADLIVQPGIGTEPFGMAVAEAMGMGRVVVASDNAGPSEIIQNGVNGVLIPRGDFDALAAAITKLLGDPASRRTIEASAYSRGRSFSVPRFADRLDEVIAEILEPKGAQT